MKFLKSKKAFEAADLISWSFFIIILGVAIFLLQLSQVALAQDFEEVSPEITNILPSSPLATI